MNSADNLVIIIIIYRPLDYRQITVQCNVIMIIITYTYTGQHFSSSALLLNEELLQEERWIFCLFIYFFIYVFSLSPSVNNHYCFISLLPLKTVVAGQTTFSVHNYLTTCTVAGKRTTYTPTPLCPSTHHHYHHHNDKQTKNNNNTSVRSYVRASVSFVYPFFYSRFLFVNFLVSFVSFTSLGSTLL